jgi:hypothetical protein
VLASHGEGEVTHQRKHSRKEPPRGWLKDAKRKNDSGKKLAAGATRGHDRHSPPVESRCSGSTHTCNGDITSGFVRRETAYCGLVERALSAKVLAAGWQGVSRASRQESG